MGEIFSSYEDVKEQEAKEEGERAVAAPSTGPSDARNFGK